MSQFDDDSARFGEEDDFMEADFRPAQVTRWKTADGRVMDMEEMTDRHLGNALPYTIRRIDGIEEQIRAKASELLDEPYLLPVIAPALMGMAKEMEEAVKALRVLRSEQARRSKTHEVAKSLRAEIEEMKGL